MPAFVSRGLCPRGRGLKSGVDQDAPLISGLFYPQNHGVVGGAVRRGLMKKKIDAFLKIRL